MILLNERLKAVAQLVPKNAKVIDVGCDHAYLSIYLKQHHIATKVVASDNNCLLYTSTDGVILFRKCPK